MASEKVNHAETARKMIEVWASTTDALLQDWLEKGNSEDRLGMGLTSAKLAQLGMMMSSYFKDVCEEFCEGPTETKAANQAIAQVDDIIRRAMANAGVGMGGDELALCPPPDQALN